ncbi:hypothetical protein [Acinetobacter baumannii]|uniref:hypothetical protein n=1 Tax=Acinetobacter baumannii TaxID=470 RepID=UPI000F7385F2|nr:hypothetical protein [Acinetobacter baumannii]
MPTNEKSCTVNAENSENIKIGKIYSDAHQVLSLKGVKDLTTGDIYHFNKSEDEVNKIFENIEKSITMQQLSPDIEITGLTFTGKLKEAYLSKDSNSFKQIYVDFTGFMSNHIALYTFAYPVIENLISKLLN